MLVWGFYGLWPKCISMSCCLQKDWGCVSQWKAVGNGLCCAFHLADKCIIGSWCNCRSCTLHLQSHFVFYKTPKVLAFNVNRSHPRTRWCRIWGSFCKTWRIKYLYSCISDTRRGVSSLWGALGRQYPEALTGRGGTRDAAAPAPTRPHKAVAGPRACALRCSRRSRGEDGGVLGYVARGPRPLGPERASRLCPPAPGLPAAPGEAPRPPCQPGPR